MLFVTFKTLAWNFKVKEWWKILFLKPGYEKNLKIVQKYLSIGKLK